MNTKCIFYECAYAVLASMTYVNTTAFLSSQSVAQSQNYYLLYFVYFHYSVCLHSGDLDIGQYVTDSADIDLKLSGYVP